MDTTEHKKGGVVPRVAINGMGRIGRAVFRIVSAGADLELVGVNDLVPPQQLVKLIEADPAHGEYGGEVVSDGDDIIIGSSRIRLLCEPDPSRLPWKDLRVDLVFECTGRFTDTEGLSKHIRAGAGRVILSAQADDDGIQTVIYGVNSARTGALLVSCASAAANCIAPVMEVMERRIGVKQMALTSHVSPAGACPSSTKGMIFLTERETSTDEINAIFREESATDRYKGILGTAEAGTAGTGAERDARASVVDLAMTRVIDGDLAKILSRHDNEWGYSSQMVRLAGRIAG